MLFPIGRSVYNAMQVALRVNRTSPFRGAKNMSMMVSYALSRFQSMTADQDFINTAYSFANTQQFFGPNGLDRTHQFSFGGSFDFPAAFRLSYNARLATALPVTLLLPGGSDPAAIFTSDWTGDGSVQDKLMSGTNIGDFGRSIKVGDLNGKIANYSKTVAGTLTPAGKALVDAGLITAAQLSSLGGVMQSLSLAPNGQLANPASINASMRFSWELRPGRVWSSIPETLVLEPSVAVFNILNVANYNALSGELNGGALSPNGTTLGNRTNRIRMGSGIYSLSAPRTFEWGFRVNF